MSGIEGRVALVTGGSRGIGAAVARTLAAQGADIAINYHANREAAEAVAAEVRALGRKAGIYQADVTIEADCAAMAAAVAGDLGPVGILVNNAGVGSVSEGQPPIATMSDDQLQRLLNAHVFGPLHLCRLLMPAMRELGRGDVIMVSSVAAQGYGPRMGVYAIAKAGMEAMAYTLAKEERQHGIRVNVVAPGLVETDMGKLLMSFTRGVGDMRQLDANMPFGFVCQPEDIANAIAFLCSDEGRYITNQRLTVNGGGF
ncbi:MAG: SDR family oxidoreductase [Dehalococcoidia bacterium]|nr:SDR family oxidoreductase [Dehalococcoidia bacterium]